MPRSRNIKPAFFKNDLLVELSFEARLLFIGLWTLADREGRLENRPKKIKMELFPADNIDIENCLLGLEESGFIEIYELAPGSYGACTVRSKALYIQILNFTKHQNPHVKEAASIIPAPDKHHTNTIRATLKPDILKPDILKPDTVEENSPTLPVKKKLFDDFHFSVADSLGNFLKEKQQRNITNSQIESWANDIRLLMERDINKRDNPKDDVIKAMQAVLDRWGEPYFPEVESGSSFRKKFIKIEQNIKRGNNGNSKKETTSGQFADAYNAIAARIDREEAAARCANL